MIFLRKKRKMLERARKFFSTRLTGVRATDLTFRYQKTDPQGIKTERKDGQGNLNGVRFLGNYKFLV